VLYAQPLEQNPLSNSSNKVKGKKMSLPWFSSSHLTSPKPSLPLNFEPSCLAQRAQRWVFVSKCATNSEGGKAELKIGSPIVIIEAPPVVKTATPMPSLRANTGQVKAGDVGRSVLLDFFSSIW
jgi:Protein of unknown function (DUF3148)